MKKFLSVLMASIMTFSATQVFAADKTRFVYNGKEVSTSAGVVFKDGYTFLPVKDMFKITGCHVIEKASNKSITAEVYGKPGYVSVFENKRNARMNGRNITLGKAPFKQDGAIYVSSSFIEEQLGVKVAYDKGKNTIYIDSNGEGKITSTALKTSVSSKTPASTVSKTPASTTSKAPVSTAASNGSSNINGDTLFEIVTGIKAYKTEGINDYYQNVTMENVNRFTESLEKIGYIKTEEAYNGYSVAYKYNKEAEEGIYDIRISYTPSEKFLIVSGPYRFPNLLK